MVRQVARVLCLLWVDASVLAQTLQAVFEHPPLGVEYTHYAVVLAVGPRLASTQVCRVKKAFLVFLVLWREH